jgi:hypothetical protein
MCQFGRLYFDSNIYFVQIVGQFCRIGEHLFGKQPAEDSSSRDQALSGRGLQMH